MMFVVLMVSHCICCLALSPRPLVVLGTPLQEARIHSKSSSSSSSSSSSRNNHRHPQYLLPTRRSA